MTTRRTLEEQLRPQLKKQLSNEDFEFHGVRRAPLLHADWTMHARNGAVADEVAVAARAVWPGKLEARNGFLNFSMNDDQLQTAINAALELGERYGASQSLTGQRVLVEFVSADPTGPLPFSLARIAAAGDALCRLLAFAGADVTREWYLNDVETSPKLKHLGESVAAAYSARFGGAARAEGTLDDGWIKRVAHDLGQDEKWLQAPETERVAHFAHAAREAAVASQRATLERFGVQFDVWTSEAALWSEGHVDNALKLLRVNGHVVERDGAKWLRTTGFGDETDRVLLRRDGSATYFAGDLAYHAYKLQRGFAKVINVWTAEHRPYVERTRAGLRALGLDENKVEFCPCEGARWRREGNTMVRSGDGGEWTLDEALAEADAASLRFWLLRSAWNETVTLEAERVTRDDESNVAYAVRLLPSRLATRLRAAGEFTATSAKDWCERERILVRLVALWPDIAENAALERAPWRVAAWLEEMATAVREDLAHAGSAHSGASANTLRAAGIAASNALRSLGIVPDEAF